MTKGNEFLFIKKQENLEKSVKMEKISLVICV